MFYVGDMAFLFYDGVGHFYSMLGKRKRKRKRKMKMRMQMKMKMI